MCDSYYSMRRILNALQSMGHPSLLNVQKLHNFLTCLGYKHHVTVCKCSFNPCGNAFSECRFFLNSVFFIKNSSHSLEKKSSYYVFLNISEQTPYNQSRLRKTDPDSVLQGSPRVLRAPGTPAPAEGFAKKSCTASGPEAGGQLARIIKGRACMWQTL